MHICAKNTLFARFGRVGQMWMDTVCLHNNITVGFQLLLEVTACRFLAHVASAMATPGVPPSDRKGLRPATVTKPSRVRNRDRAIILNVQLLVAGCASL